MARASRSSRPAARSGAGSALPVAATASGGWPARSATRREGACHSTRLAPEVCGPVGRAHHVAHASDRAPSKPHRRPPHSTRPSRAPQPRIGAAHSTGRGPSFAQTTPGGESRRQPPVVRRRDRPRGWATRCQRTSAWRWRRRPRRVASLWTEHQIVRWGLVAVISWTLLREPLIRATFFQVRGWRLFCFVFRPSRLL